MDSFCIQERTIKWRNWTNRRKVFQVPCKDLHFREKSWRLGSTEVLLESARQTSWGRTSSLRQPRWLSRPRLTNFQVKTCKAILDKYQIMLRSVLKEGFRGGREATVEQLTEQFCQKVEFNTFLRAIQRASFSYMLDHNSKKNSSFLCLPLEIKSRAQKPARTGRCQHSSRRGRGRRRRRRRRARPGRGRRWPTGGSGQAAEGSQSCERSWICSHLHFIFGHVQ